jgi:hypothetical protein
MSNGRGGIVLKPSQLASEEETFFKGELTEEGRLGGLKWIDKKLAAKELSEIKRRIEELERERKLVDESIRNISKSNLPKASSDFYIVRRNVEKSIENARKLWLALAGAEAAGALAAALASGGGLFIAGAAGTVGIVGGLLGSHSLSSNVETEVERVGKGVQLVEVRERLKDELNDFERECRRLQRRKKELLRLCGEREELPIREHIQRMRDVMDNLKLMNDVQLGFLKKVRKRRAIPLGKLREMHDSVQELVYISSTGDKMDRSLLVRNIAREMSTDLVLKMEDAADISELSNTGLNYIGKTISVFEKQLSDLRFVPPLYFE